MVYERNQLQGKSFSLHHAAFYSLVVSVDGLLCTPAKDTGLTDCCTILFALWVVKFQFHNVI